MDYIAQDNPIAAVRMDERFAEASARLAEQPFLGKTGWVSGTREWFPHESYRLVYEIHRDAVWILALVATALQWPPVVE